MIPNLEDDIKKYFRGIEKSNLLLFTTFGLDEIVLVQLLRKYRVSNQTRIVVIHEIMKHNAPGFLKTYYPDSKIISVEIPRKKGHKYCPIFHSKIWMEVSRSPFRCRRLAIHSINLTRYHLGEKEKSLESFFFLEDMFLKLPKDPLFKESILLRGRKTSRIKIKPRSVFVDAESKKVSLLVLNQSVGQLVDKVLEVKGEPVIECAAPFVNKTTVRSLMKNENQIKIWKGRRNDGTGLHAKIVGTKRCLFLGSPNITNQAYGLGTKGLINHETILLRGKPKGFKLETYLQGFPRVKMEDLDDENHEDYEDQDVSDIGASDWNQAKDWATNGPDDVVLTLNKKTGKAEILITGSVGRITKIVMCQTFENGNFQPLLTLKSKERIQVSKENQKHLVRTVVSPPTIIKGIRGKKTYWIRELNLGEFWKWRESNIRRLKSIRMLGNGTLPAEESPHPGRWIVYDDVREQRDMAYSNDRLLLHNHELNNWLCKYGDRKLIIPQWCIELGKELRRVRNA
jgi:hypothetical protein